MKSLYPGDSLLLYIDNINAVHRLVSLCYTKYKYAYFSQHEEEILLARYTSSSKEGRKNAVCTVM